jgi:hypothetical protein
MRAELASHITISAKRFVGLSATGSTHHRQAAAPAEVTNVLVPADFRQMSECLPSPEFG